MTKSLAVQVASLVLSALLTLGIVAGANSIATHEYATAQTLVMAQGATMHVASTRAVVIVGRRAAKT